MKNIKFNRAYSSNYKAGLIKKIIFGFISLVLLIDIILLPFVTEPFVFENGISEEYVAGVIIVLIVWSCFVFLNHADLKKITILSFENTILFAKTYSEKSKERYYCQLGLFLKVVTSALAVLILLGLFSIVDQYNLFLKNFHIFLAS